MSSRSVLLELVSFVLDSVQSFIGDASTQDVRKAPVTTHDSRTPQELACSPSSLNHITNFGCHWSRVLNTAPEYSNKLKN